MKARLTLVEPWRHCQCCRRPAGTPVRLDPLDTPENIGAAGGPRDDGPRFSVAGVPRRESITRRMAARASTSLKRKAHAYSGTPLHPGINRQPIADHQLQPICDLAIRLHLSAPSCFPVPGT